MPARRRSMTTQLSRNKHLNHTISQMPIDSTQINTQKVIETGKKVPRICQIINQDRVSTTPTSNSNGNKKESKLIKMNKDHSFSRKRSSMSG